jgi:ribonucleoside-diphosphate reductase alpha chain
MQIVKRDGSRETVKLEKISKRIERHCKDLKNIDSISVAQKVVQGLYDGVSSVELDHLAMETAYSMSVKHPEYDKLASRLAISALHKTTDSTFSGTIEKLYNVKDTNGNDKSLISKAVAKFIKKNAAVLDSAIDYNRDYLFDYFGFKTLERSYLMKINNVVVERPQHMWMRVACGIHSDDIDAALNTYQLLSTMKATHATPTLFNAGTPKNQLSSCFLVAMKDDSIEGIYDTLKETALISQSAGGVGLHIHNIRSRGSLIYGTGGISSGIVPMLKTYSETSKYVDQCFHPETPISTTSGLQSIASLPEKIKTASTPSSSFKAKEFPYQGTLRSIKLNNSQKPIRCTPQHLILAVRNVSHLEASSIKEKISRHLIKMEWVEADQLTKNDVIVKRNG